MNPRISLREPQKNFSSQRKKTKENFRFGYQSTYVGLLSIIGFLLIYYVWILNANATQGYNIRELEKTQKELKKELNILESRISEFRSLDLIEKSDMADGMQDVEETEYVLIRGDVQYVYNN